MGNIIINPNCNGYNPIYIIMNKKLQFIIRREDPFDNDNDGSWDNEDINTMCSKMVFEGIITTLEEKDNKPTFIGSEKCLMGYDVIEKIDGYCYVRTIEKEPGKYYEYWREPTKLEMEEFIKLLKDVYTDQGDVNLIKEDIIYQWYLTKERDSKINSIID